MPRLTLLVFLLAAAALMALRHRTSADDTANARAKPTSTAPDRSASATQQPAASSPRTVGDELLKQASARLERRATVSARLRHQAFLGGQQLYGLGSYWQQGTGEELRVRLELQIAGQQASLLQVSNSRFLWIERLLPTGRSVTRIDLRQLRADPSLGGVQLGELQPGKANWSTMRPELIAHCGGMPSLLAALADNFSFLPPQAMRLAPQSGAEAPTASVPVFAIVGHWRPEKLARLLQARPGSEDDGQPPESPGSETIKKIPPRLPQEVLLLVGQADLFPYRIEYRRLETPPANPDGPPIPFQLSANPLVVVELLDVTFDAPIAAGQFDYAPGDAEWVDQTAALLERLHRDGQEQMAVRTLGDGSARPTR